MSASILKLCLTIGILFLKSGEGRVALPTIAPIDSTETEILTEEVFDKRVRSSACEISINGDLVEPQPLFLVPGTNRFWNQLPNGIISIPLNTSIDLYCTEFFKKPFTKSKLIKATCLKQNIFIVDNKKYMFNDFICSSENTHIARRTGNYCYIGSSLIEIGFNVSGRILQTLLVCHDEINQSTLYVHHNLTSYSNGYQKSVPRPSFIQGDFYKGKDVNNLYTKEKQKKTIGKILGGNHEKYFDEKKSLFLARGHLSAKVDHIFGAQQKTTFYFINAAPQWQRFNAGNWERIEDGVRKFVAKNKLQVECYTGTWGISELRDINGRFQQIYLSFDENNNGQIPVPKLYYRVVLEPASKRGIVLIGVNNPHLTMSQIEDDYIICDDISDLIKWINWKKDDILSGYSYACEVNQFSKVVKHLPKLDVKGILY